MDQYIGKLLDNRYEILERIGTGGMAVVYKARCHRLNRLVAIKILKSELAQDAEFRRRFHDESQAVAMLSHPNIVAVYDVSHSDDLDYIVMELIDGITLKQYMQKKGEPLNWREALHFITQIMKGLSHAHSRGIIHRDIKPHNIMILRDGSVKVADFGIARLTSAAQSTLTQEALGSVHYISPEQARGSHIDARSDIYSAGVVLYEMVTGRLPYEGDSPISVAIQHINSIPLSPKEINPDIPEALEAITMKAMAANVDQRYSSADVMLADLEEFRKNPSINFEYTAADLLTGGDEPTQVMDTNGSLGMRAAAAAKSGGSTPLQGHPSGRRRRGAEEEDDEMDYDDRRRRSREDKGSAAPILLAVGAILIFLVGIGYFLWVSFFSDLLNPQIPEYEVPNLVGAVYEDVKDDVAVLGKFTIERGQTIASEEVPEGQIINQNPEAGATVKAGSLIITVDVSGGSSHFVLDDYYNRRAAEVKALLEDKGYKVVLEPKSSEAINKDYIISQSPEKGTPMEPGAEVTLVVSTGPEIKPVMMIPLTGKPQETAEAWLREMNLIVGSTTPVFDDLQPEGYVVSQSAPAGSEISEGTIVNLQISKGPDPGIEPSDDPDEPDVSPPPTPSDEPSPPPSVSPSPPVEEVQKSITVNLPDDRDMVQVRITVSGVEKHNKQYETVFRTLYIPVMGSGTNQEVCVYLDGELVDTQYADFVK